MSDTPPVSPDDRWNDTSIPYSDFVVPPNAPNYQPLPFTVAVNPDVLLHAGSSPVDEKAFRDRLRLRLSELEKADRDVGISNQLTNELIDRVMATIPANARTDTVAVMLDLRPYLQQAIDQGLAAPSNGGLSRAQVYEGVLRGYQRDVKRRVEGVPNQTNVSGAASDAQRFDASRVGLDPIAAMMIRGQGTDTQGAPLTGDAVTGELDNPNFEVPGVNSAVTDEATIQALSQAGWTDAQNIDGSGVPITLSIESSRLGEDLPGIGRGGAPSKSLSVLGAMDYLYNLSEDGIKNLQKNLVDAGYYDRLGIEPGAIGDRTDEATRKAWGRALLDAVAAKKPVLDVVRQQTATYRQQKAAAYMQALPTVTPETLDLTFDNISQNIIGRNLTTDEKTMVRGYIRKMQQQRSTEVAGDAHPTGGTVDTSLGFATEDVATAVAANIRESTAGTGYALSTALKRVQG